MSTNAIDEILDLAAPATDTTSTTTDTTSTNPDGAANGTETNAEVSSADEGGALYPNVGATYTASQVGDANPDGTLTITEFAAHLTLENLTRKGMGIEGIVQPANIYSGIKAKRNPLPVVLVFADDADQSDLSKAKVFLPVEAATKAWNERPARGEGAAASASKRDKDDLMTALAKKTAALVKVQERLTRAEEQKANITKQIEKYHRWLAEHYKDATPVEIEDSTVEGGKRTQTHAEAVAAAISKDLEIKLDELAAEEDAAKNADIPDNASAE